MNIIDERDVRTIHRKIKKKEYDEVMTLSVGDDGQWVRLLDEGMVVTAGGYIDFYIMKGALQKYLDALSDDYEGSINLGHMDFATFPILLGKWTKEDLRLVDIGDGRHGLDVYLRLDSDSLIVKELRRADYDLAVSAEFRYSVNEAATEKYGFLIIDDVFIFDFAIVGEPGNVNSSGIRLKGGAEKVNIKELAEKLEGENKEGLSEIIATLSAQLDAELETTEAAEEAAEEPEDTADEPTEDAEEPEEDEAEEEDAEDETEGTEDAEDEEDEAEETPEDAFKELHALIGTLTENIKTLSAENTRLRGELDKKSAQITDWASAFKTLKVSISGDDTAEAPAENKAPDPTYTDGVGKLD